MDFLELAKQRKTTYEFSPKDVSAANVKQIIEAGRWAPSAANSQPWHFIVVRNEDKIQKIIGTVSPLHPFIAFNPPVMIAVVFEPDAWAEKHFPKKVKTVNLTEPFLCIGMCSLSMVLEAQSLGIDSAILTPNSKTTGKILKVKEPRIIPLVVALGYETKDAFQKKRERKNLDEIVSYEEYGKK